MTKNVAKRLIGEAACDRKIARVTMVYQTFSYSLIPLAASDRLFLAVQEKDFAFDGFRISRFRDVADVRVGHDKFDEMLRDEGLFHALRVPEIDLESWQAVFEDLKAMGEYVIVEYETAVGERDDFTIGKIDRVHRGCLYMYHFDAEGIWEDEPYRIPYTEVTSVTFGSRYVGVFAKYVSDAPRA